MRILCLNLQKRAPREIAEVFLKFSPRVQYRTALKEDSSESSLVFIDITATSALFSGEAVVLQKAMQLAHKFYPDATAAISDTPQGAQVFAYLYPSYISEPNQEKIELGRLPLTILTELEGLNPWEKKDSIHQIISLFHIIGLQKIEKVYELKAEAFRERWGKVGELLWKRLNHVEKQFISPLEPSPTFSHYNHLDEPVSILSFLLYEVEKSLSFLVQRLSSRSSYTQKISLTLHCEYSDRQHLVEIPLTPACRDQSLFMDLIEEKLSHLDFENPIRQFEVDMQAVPENAKQFDFFTPKTSDKDKLQKLVYLFRQKGVHSSFLKINNEVFPENTLSSTPEPVSFHPLKTQFEDNEGGLKKKPVHGEFPTVTPRPSQLLDKPLEIRSQFLKKKFRLLPHQERLEDRWWKSKDASPEVRDYQYAVSDKGQLVWLFRKSNPLKADSESNYFIHGYCD